MKWHESRLWCKFNKLSANYIFGMPYCLYINYKFCKLVGMRTSKLPSQLSMSKMAVFTTVTAHWPTVSHRVIIRQCSNDRPQSLSRRTISYQASCGCQSWGKSRSFSWQYVSNALPDVYIMIDYICFILVAYLVGVDHRKRRVLTTFRLRVLSRRQQAPVVHAACQFDPYYESIDAISLKIKKR